MLISIMCPWGGVNYVFELQDYPIFLNISYFISKLIVRIAVPLYFVISGYLFFDNISIFNAGIYLTKLRKRIKSLALPYVFWNLEVLFILFLAQSFMPSMLSGDNILIRNFSFSDWLMAFWEPICGQFWYIRDLLIVITATPILYYMAQKIPFIFLFGLAFFWILGFRHDPVGFSSTSFFFFYLGALFPIKKISLLDFVRLNKRWCYIFASFGITIMMISYNVKDICEISKGMNYAFNVIFNVIILFMMVAALGISDTLLKTDRIHICDCLSKASFFIYAFHAYPLLLIIKLFVKYNEPLTDISALIVYILSPVVTILMSLLVFLIMKNNLPRFTALITGNRSK